jgi:hypothetical protein
MFADSPLSMAAGTWICPIAPACRAEFKIRSVVGCVGKRSAGGLLHHITKLTSRIKKQRHPTDLIRGIAVLIP